MACFLTDILTGREQKLLRKQSCPARPGLPGGVDAPAPGVEEAGELCPLKPFPKYGGPGSALPSDIPEAAERLAGRAGGKAAEGRCPRC